MEFLFVLKWAWDFFDTKMDHKEERVEKTVLDNIYEQGPFILINIVTLVPPVPIFTAAACHAM